jgi:hypothetical protein
MKITVNCPKCLKLVIAEKDFFDCFICPKCDCVVAKLLGD